MRYYKLVTGWESLFDLMELPPNGQGRSFRAAKNFKGNVTVQKTSAIKHLVGHLYGHYLDGTEKTLSGPKWDKDKKKSPNAFAEKQFERKLPIKK